MKLLKIIIQKTLIILALILMITMIDEISFADVGSFESYDSGSSWSSSSSDWGSSSSSSWDWGSDSSSSYSSSGSRHSGNGRPLGIKGNIIIGIEFVTIVVIAFAIDRWSKGRHPKLKTIKQHHSTEKHLNYNNEMVISLIRQVDPNFSRVKFESFAKEVFIKLQNAWTDRDWEKIRPFESAELFEQHKMQLDGYIKNNQINVMDRICVNDINFVSFEQSSDKDILVIDLDSRMSDYIIDATTKQVIRGNKDTEYYHTYTLTFTRKKGNLTENINTNKLNTTNCPNCGAPTIITSAGRCEYCNSIIVTSDHGWVLSNLTRRH